MEIAKLKSKHRKVSTRHLGFFTRILLLGSFLLSSCRSALSSLEPDITPTVISSTTPTALAIVTPSATPSPVFTATLAPTKPFTVRSMCPEVSATFPKGKYHGAIAYFARYREFEVLLHMETGETGFLPNETLGYAITSPDRNQIAYEELDSKTGNRYLRVRVLDTHQSLRLPWPSGEQGLARWIDNERLLFTSYSEKRPYSHLVLNPFTEQSAVLAADFPDISDKEINWDQAGATAYDPTLDYVVYPVWDETTSEHKYVLWHIPTQTRLAVLPGNSYGGFTTDYQGYIYLDGVISNPPEWSTDGAHVALISSAADKPAADEIYVMTRQGDVHRLTDFSPQFETANIRALSWSPDGKSIAFFITAEPAVYELEAGTKRNERLAILNTETRETTIYCISGDTFMTPTAGFLRETDQILAPLWSPDGKAIVVEHRYKVDASRLILMDLVDGSAYEIGPTRQPISWMLSEP